MAYKIITFHSRNDAFAVLNYIKSLGIVASIINTPRELSYSCGLCIKIDCDNQTIRKVINNSKNISFDKVFSVNIVNGIQKVYSQLTI